MTDTLPDSQGASGPLRKRARDSRDDHANGNPADSNGDADGLPDNDGEDEEDSELPERPALTGRASKQPTKRRKRQSAHLTEGAVKETLALKEHINKRIKEISDKHKASHSAIRKQLGYSVEFGREASPYHRWAKWYAATQPNPFPGNLPERNREISRLWAELQGDPSELAEVTKVVDTWHSKHTSNADEYDAKKIMNTVVKKARKLATSAASNDRVAIVIIAAHAHSRVSPSIIGTKQSILQLEESVKDVESVMHLKSNFHSRVTARPPANGVQPYVDFDEIPVGSGDNRYDDRWSILTRALPLHMIRIVNMGLAAADVECAAWTEKSNEGRRMVYLELFDVLAEVGLCMDGWPVACTDLLAPGSDWSEDDGDTVIVHSGSLEHWNTWPRDMGRLLYSALCEKSVRVRAVNV